MRQNVGHRQNAVAVVRLVDHAPEELDRAVTAVDGGLGAQRGGLERRRDSDDLEYRARLEGHRDGVVEARRGRLAGLGRLIGVEDRIAGHGQDVARVRVHDYGASAGGVVVFAGGAQLALGHELDALVDAEGDVLARRGLGGNLGGDGPPQHVGQHGDLAGPPGQFRVQFLFQPQVAPLLEVHRAHDVTGQRAVGIVAARLLLELHPVELQTAQGFGFRQGDLAFYPQEPAALGFALLLEGQPVFLHRRVHPRQQLLTVHAQGTGQDGSGGGAIRNQERIDGDAVGGNAHRQDPAFAVQNAAPRCVHPERVVLLAVGQFLIGFMGDDLELYQAAKHHDGPQKGARGKPERTGGGMRPYANPLVLVSTAPRPHSILAAPETPGKANAPASYLVTFIASALSGLALFSTTTRPGSGFTRRNWPANC